jgi:hypothetical protein
MLRILPLLALLLTPLALGCGEEKPEDDTAPPEGDTDTDSDADADADSDTDADTDPKAVGREALAFAMEDINPSSASYGAVVESAALAGTPYGLLFMDSRCKACIELADDVWAALVKHPAWQEALPIFGVESFSAWEGAPYTAEGVVENNDLPYLVDLEENSAWAYYNALNHDLIVISGEGAIEAWLPLYTWPDDMVDFEAYMAERFGE